VKPARSILLVEDEAIIALDLGWKLEEAGYRVIGTAATGEEAVARTLREHPDVVLMDHHLAGKIDGIEAALRIRERDDVPIIFMTGYSLDDVFRERVRPIAPAACLNKPVDFGQLLKTLAGACGA
jgi:CheY-like chemotaxis protein